ncbi:MAG: ArsR family transcriptional regulator [Gemmatimonadaceae bacterium]|nr:ArsR family transcriptional regulator [Gemmatimonadaceae bacterium]
MSVWEREYGSTTRGHIVTLLRGGNRSVDELAAELGLTDNAVRAHLAILLREQIVEAVSVRREGGVGKPASIYAIAPGAQPLFSRAYSPLLAALLAELRAHKTPDAMRRLLQRVGRRMAPREHASGSLEARARAGSELLNELGGSTDVVREKDGYVIRGHGCPLSEAVSECAETCSAVEQMLTEMTGARVVESCDRNGPPNCQFRVPTPG